MAAQSKQVAAIAWMVRRHYWTAPTVGHRVRRRHMFVTCHGKTEITESVQIVLEAVLTNPMVTSIFDGDPRQCATYH